MVKNKKVFRQVEEKMAAEQLQPRSAGANDTKLRSDDGKLRITMAKKKRKWVDFLQSIFGCRPASVGKEEKKKYSHLSGVCWRGFVSKLFVI